jgi:hypothetical protein
MYLATVTKKSEVNLSIIAGLLYCSWPLGYWLNPRVATHSLASGLEATNQPFNWFFIATDIASSLLLVIVALLLWHKYKYSKIRQIVGVTLLCIVMFALNTIADALLPEHCIPNLMQCASFTQDHYLLVHGIFSIAASIFLFVGLCILWCNRPRKPFLRILVAGYIVFGMISLIEAITPGRNGNWSENYYITLCAIWIAYIPWAISSVAVRKSAKLK